MTEQRESAWEYEGSACRELAAHSGRFSAERYWQNGISLLY